MLEIDCRICKNLGDNECLKYGKDCDIAVERCASDGFTNYKKVEDLQHAGLNKIFYIKKRNWF